jgi:hypothetical protein
VHEAISTARATLASIAAMWPAAAPSVRREEDRLRDMAAIVKPPPIAGGDARIPARNPEVRGPLGVYYFDYFTEKLSGSQTDALVHPPETALGKRPQGEVLTYEALNFVDGKRSVSEIRDLLSGRYEPVPLPEVSEYLDLLERVDVIGWRKGSSD